ncbi:hypothetical protein BTN49_1704 [Candidatus Enterovibrio escicola]|uniref:Uncharacterized protein n=1 Tax=Candidatus Enterovibrio escicola TaxID=1927127 RepID=A0A2A5T3L3_9GAMM|nr:hypothetical protein BTN49_1704 [Candidatus Enterovibrio escacola]
MLFILRHLLEPFIKGDFIDAPKISRVYFEPLKAVCAEWDIF